MILRLCLWLMLEWLMLQVGIAIAEQKPELKDWDFYQDKWKRDPFVRVLSYEEEHRDKEAEQALAREAEMKAAEAQLEAKMARFRVTGTGMVLGSNKAFFDDSVTGKSYYLAEGESEDGIRVVKVTSEVVTVSVGQEQWDVAVHKN